MTNPFLVAIRDPEFECVLQSDRQLNAFLTQAFNVVFAYGATNHPETLVVEVVQGSIRINAEAVPMFNLSAKADVWARYFVHEHEQELG